MYVNQIDNIIDKILDRLYLDGLRKDPTFQMIINEKKINFVEYREKINSFIQSFLESLDTTEIQRLINIKENLIKIMDIIKRYIAYYYFLSLAYHYQGTVREFRNNLIQYSKLQESSTFHIKNFFDTENNYQVISFFKIIQDSKYLLTMTELQKKTLNPLQFKEAIDFLNELGKEYVNNYLLAIVRSDIGEEVVDINVHNLIKTIVFGEIYRNQEQKMVFDILNDIEESKREYTYIDIVVTTEEYTDFGSFQQIFLGEKNAETLAQSLYELVNDINRLPPTLSLDKKNNYLLKLSILTPIVDDFLRYHRDTERLVVDTEKKFILPTISASNSKNIQLALLYQQRKKKENTKAQLIINRVDTISDYYSENVKNNPEFKSNIKKYFHGPLSHRKAVLHNYLDEIRVMNKIINQGRQAMEGNEYFLELKQINRQAYFNFKDFQQYGTSLILETAGPINLLRYSNIEFKNQLSNQEVEMRTGVNDLTINLVGLAIGPLEKGLIQCIRKENLIDIRDVTIKYPSQDGVRSLKTENGYKMFVRIVKHFFIGTIEIRTEPKFEVYRNLTQMKELNKDIVDKVIYWIYDVEKDDYKMDTYENIKSYHFQETIQFMNSKIYDKITGYLHKRLAYLVNSSRHLPVADVQLMIELYAQVNQLFIKQEDQIEIIIKELLQKREWAPSLISEPVKKLPMPELRLLPEEFVYQIKIDLINPLRPKEYIKLEAYAKKPSVDKESPISLPNSKCQHENEWKEVAKLRSQGLNKYNSAMTQFIEKYVFETVELDFICRICGQLLPIKQYVQDGSFDNNTQRFIPVYVPIDIPLEDIREYQKYRLTIRYLDSLINRISLITGTNMLVGQHIQIQQKRKALVKNIIDIIVKHNSLNLRKDVDNDERIEAFAKKFNINKTFDSVFFFELEDSIFNFSPTVSDENTNLNRLKFNNILLYFLLIFMTELNGAQITMMTSDKIGNVYTFLKYGPKLFNNLLIKKNINDIETVPVWQYPVFCYLIFVLSYFLIKYKLWYYPAASKKTFDPVVQKVIIHSFLDIVNGIVLGASKFSQDYVYLLTVSKIYTHLNGIFRSTEIINILKRNHLKHAERIEIVEKEKAVPVSLTTYPVEKGHKIKSYRISSGIQYDRKDQLLYEYLPHLTDITNCPTGPNQGDFHTWKNREVNFICPKCGKVDDEVNGEYDSTDDNYYFILQKIADRRCLRGTLHDFKEVNGEFVCTICKKKRGQTYTREELNHLADNLNKLEDERVKGFLSNMMKERQREEEEQKAIETLFNQLVDRFKKESGDKWYGQMSHQVDKLIAVFGDSIGNDTNLEVSKYPVYLDDDVYIIDHAYDGTIFPEPIIFTQSSGKVLFRENHPFFKADVYYYIDNRTAPIEVFYHAVSLKLLGYKEKHKNYQLVKNVNNYLQISTSLKNRLLLFGYETKYIDVGDIFMKNSIRFKDANENYFQILDNLIREHVFKIKSIIDKLSSLIYRVKNYLPQEEKVPTTLQTTDNIENIVNKYAKMIMNASIGPNQVAFEDWNSLRQLFQYWKVNWQETNIRVTENFFVNSEMINYYDIASSMMMFYLVEQFSSIIRINTEPILKTSLVQLIIEMVNYIFNLYNVDMFKNAPEIKRFDYILSATEYTIDLLRKGQGLVESRELEKELDETQADVDELETSKKEKEEIDDLKEEAEALDVEPEYEEDEDYYEGPDYDA